jgi:RNA polymerase sigma-70 factor (ECF subfamily)
MENQGLDLAGEKELIEAVNRGDQSAFETLYRHYADMVYRFLWRRTKSPDVASDLVQETFIRLWRKADTLDAERGIKALLFQIARNLSIDHLRAQTRVEIDELDPGQAAPQKDPLMFDTKQRIQGAIRSLPENQRTAFSLSRFEGLTYSEIAEAMGISVKTVEVHIGRALRKLRTSLHDLAQLIFFTFKM